MADIITLAEYHVFDDSPSPTFNDAQIAQGIVTATGEIEQLAGRVFEVADPSPVDGVETLNGNGTSRLYTHNAPLLSVSKVEYWNGVDWFEYEINSYPRAFKAGSNVIYFTSGYKFYQGYQNIRATITYGFETAMPDDLQFACYLRAKHAILMSDRMGIDSMSDGEQTFSFTQGRPQRTLVGHLKQADEIVMKYKTVY